MGFAAPFGWAVILGGTVLASVSWMVLLRVAATALGSTVQGAWLVAAGTVLATGSASLLCRQQDFRIGLSHERPLPFMLAVALLAAVASLSLLPGGRGIAAHPSRDTAIRIFCSACIIVPFAVWFVCIPVQSWRRDQKNQTRSAYDDALSESDQARAEVILDANPWLRFELEHALDDTVPDGKN